ncbi:hypothetical protein DPX16_3300 [Anabarilius grahami]|uniref:Uncharacterized protein n=1 Tax=Anabarilius grahami TaxID=495550 RepID=A0A3N0XL85_ANAGA|nr:hypothetical protein DPX16_3300 [Anabarilius grahami]
MWIRTALPHSCEQTSPPQANICNYEMALTTLSGGAERALTGCRASRCPRTPCSCCLNLPSGLGRSVTASGPSSPLTAGLKKQSKHTQADPRRAESLTRTSLPVTLRLSGGHLHAVIGRDDCVRTGARANIARHINSTTVTYGSLVYLQVFLLQMDVNLRAAPSNQRLIYLDSADRERVTVNSWVLINISQRWQKSCGKCSVL